MIRCQHPIWSTLFGGLWHTTLPARFSGIMEAGAIFPEPDIPDAERWATNEGPDRYPFVRSLGGVSLFDFKGFDLDSYAQRYPLSNVLHFVPYRAEWGAAVWIEIDRDAIADGFLSAAAVLAKWKSEGRLYRPLMPNLEAAHVGPIKRAAFKRALKIDALDGVVRAIDL